MCSRVFLLRWMLMALAAGLLSLGTAQAIAQTEEPPTDVTTPSDGTEPEDAESADAANPPSYITEMMEAGKLTQDQADSMRADGMGWGEIRIAVRLAEEISAASGGTVTFDQALAEVLAARDSGQGFGEIAKEHNLKVGNLVGNGDQKKGNASEKGLDAQQGSESGETKKAPEKKRGFLARVGRFLGFGKKERVSKASSTDVAASGKVERAQKVEKVEKMEKAEKMERPSKPEKPEKPARPEKPEKPERGPNR
ncbi:MAG: hypothetical protein ACM3VT_21190 [Solirubrobacterales bacterium]